MTFLAALAGYVIGSIPTAGLLGRLKGVDLRRDGSGNPGTKNALSTGGPLLAASVLTAEVVKGYGAVWLGASLTDDAGAIAAGIGAIAGNVFNIWYRFEGGKGLGISAGVLVGVWPWSLPFAVGLIVIALLIKKSAGIASLITLAGLVIMAVVWPIYDLPTGGETDAGLLLLTLAMAGIMGWKHWRDSPLNPAWHPEPPAPT